jgi:hypothetical protein
MDRPVTTLQKQDFALYERGKRQEIRYFDEEDAPISVAVLLDISKSMSDKIETERTALRISSIIRIRRTNASRSRFRTRSQYVLGYLLAIHNMDNGER